MVFYIFNVEVFRMSGALYCEELRREYLYDVTRRAGSYDIQITSQIHVHYRTSNLARVTWSRYFKCIELYDDSCIFCDHNSVSNN